MTSNQPIRAAVLGASGYTGADLIRLAARHPDLVRRHPVPLRIDGDAGFPVSQGNTPNSDNHREHAATGDIAD